MEVREINLFNNILISNALQNIKSSEKIGQKCKQNENKTFFVWQVGKQKRIKWKDEVEGKINTLPIDCHRQELKHLVFGPFFVVVIFWVGFRFFNFQS